MPWLDYVLLAVLLIGAPLTRLVGLDGIEPNILPDEADHLTLLYRILLGHGPGLFDLSWDGNPAASLYPAIPFLKLFGPSYVALRLSTAVASLLTLLVFFLLARHSFGLFASLAATCLLAFSGWFLFFSRNGEVNVWVLLYAVSAAYSLQLALARGQWRHWVTAGLFCGLGWYSYLGGVFILPIMLLYLAMVALLERPRRQECLRGGAVLMLLTVLLLLPRLPILLQKRDAVELYVGTRSVLKDADPAEIPELMAGQLTTSIRAFVLMDGGLEGNPRYLEPGRPVFDPLTAALYLGGLVLSLRRPRKTALWWCFLVTIILGVHSLTIGIPDGARALTALPAMMLFAGLAVQWLIERPRLGRLARLALGAAIPLTALSNWTQYVEWQRQPQTAFYRQPAVEAGEFAAWQERQLAEARAGRPGFTVNEWHRMRLRNRPASAPTPPR